MHLFNVLLFVLLLLFIILKAIALIRREAPNIDDENPYLRTELAAQVLPAEMAGYVSSTADSVSSSAPSSSSEAVDSGTASSVSDQKIGHDCGHNCGGAYARFFKPLFDSLLSFLGLLLLSPVYLLIIIAIKLDDPGPVFFMQKRVGKDKHFFMLHKFRSMAMNTPHDMPTHLLANPEQYITRVGRFLRRSSLDEIPQIWDIFRGKMSIIGPRPALWNQADLIACRDRWRANDVMPGLTGLAQISGRDELEIEDKARLDGEYTKALRSSWTQGLLIDLKCFFGTVLPVLRSDGVVEGKNTHQ